MPSGFQVGPFFIHFYGVIAMVGVLAATWLSIREAKRWGEDPVFIADVLPWIVIAGVVGARIWHVFTPPQSMVESGITTRYYLTHLYEAVAIWKGGLGIFGAVTGGAVALWIYARIKGENALRWFDIIAPGLALGQAIGRWGNFINQEVYGLPSNVPWAIFIDKAHRLTGYKDIAYYHPLFLYESLWNLLNMTLLLWIGRKYKDKLHVGSVFLIYLIVYGVGRFGLEFLRLDISPVEGVNANQAFVAFVAVLAAILLFALQRSKSRRDKEEFRGSMLDE
ncbi:MAG: prolipoprotein diacylglyceryl transferase [Anaerolineales bacterium]